eukprot:1292018-Rhodomonas_salina.5
MCDSRSCRTGSPSMVSLSMRLDTRPCATQQDTCQQLPRQAARSHRQDKHHPPAPPSSALSTPRLSLALPPQSASHLLDEQHELLSDLLNQVEACAQDHSTVSAPDRCEHLLDTPAAREELADHAPLRGRGFGDALPLRGRLRVRVDARDLALQVRQPPHLPLRLRHAHAPRLKVQQVLDRVKPLLDVARAEEGVRGPEPQHPPPERRRRV